MLKSHEKPHSLCCILPCAIPLSIRLVSPSGVRLWNYYYYYYYYFSVWSCVVWFSLLRLAYDDSDQAGRHLERGATHGGLGTLGRASAAGVLSPGILRCYSHLHPSSVIASSTHGKFFSKKLTCSLNQHSSYSLIRGYHFCFP